MPVLLLLLYVVVLGWSRGLVQAGRASAPEPRLALEEDSDEGSPHWEGSAVGNRQAGEDGDRGPTVGPGH